MDTPPPVQPDSGGLPTAVAPADHPMMKVVRSGGGWFFWIAGLSLVNSIAIHSGASISFIVGLGITMIADAVFHSIGTFGHVLAYLFDAVVLGFFVVLGIYSRRGKVWAFVTGGVLYALDAVLFIVLPETPDWFPVGFHAFALWGIWAGLVASRRIKAEAEAAA